MSEAFVCDVVVAHIQTCWDQRGLVEPGVCEASRVRVLTCNAAVVVVFQTFGDNKSIFVIQSLDRLHPFASGQVQGETSAKFQRDTKATLA